MITDVYFINLWYDMKTTIRLWSYILRQIIKAAMLMNVYK